MNEREFLSRANARELEMYAAMLCKDQERAELRLKFVGIVLAATLGALAGVFVVVYLR